jgi:hypothetical protein
MSLHHIANHLASKGRHGDETLVHMTKGEVAGLQALAKKNGTTLTINPHTGLPEAFKLKSLLPMAIGAGLAVATGGTSLALTPWMIGAGVGGFETLRTGSLKEGLIAGLGAYGGAGLAGMAGLGAAGGAGAGAGGASSTGVSAASPGASTIGGNLGQSSAVTGYGSGAAGSGASAAGSGGLGISATSPAASSFSSNLGANLGSSVGSGTAAVPSSLGISAASPGAASFTSSLGAAQPSALQTFASNVAASPWDAAKTGAYALAPAIAAGMEPKTGAPEIKSDTDMGQRYIYDSGYDNSIPGRTGLPAYTKVSNEEAKKYYGFADGGEIQYPTGESVVRMASGGISSLGSYSDGGRLLKGPGDGMSDNIPAQIGAKQPARLADGEFVVPADVVSHLGNGSTDAGAKQLYKMMDKIRTARTGRKAQGKQVNPNKFMPA